MGLILKKSKRFNLYYSSPYFYLYDGDDTGELIFKTEIEIDAKTKQNEMEELHLSERNNGQTG